MSLFNRKGFRNMKVQDRTTGKVVDISVKIGSTLDRQMLTQKKKLTKQQREQVRAYKAQLRAGKKQVPLAERSKVNWAELTAPK